MDSFFAFDSGAMLSETGKQAFLESVVPVHFAKGEYLIRTGDTDAGLYFLRKGLVRYVYLSSEGKEFNKSFAAEGGIAGCLRSMLSEQPCRFSVQALEAVDALMLSGEKRRLLYRDFPEWERLGRVYAEQLALKKEAREAEFLLDSAETRYRTFLQEYPGLVERIPQYHIASYLGITDVALSRIRSKMKASS